MGVPGRSVCRIYDNLLRILGPTGLLERNVPSRLLLPGLGSACTGVILKEKVITVCGGLGASLGLLFLPQLCKGGNFPLTWTILMAIAMIISLVVPGHILNYKAKKS